MRNCWSCRDIVWWISHILTGELGMKKWSAKWVPWLLTQDQKCVIVIWVWTVAKPAVFSSIRFPSLFQIFFGGWRFSSNELNARVQEHFAGLEESNFQNGIKALVCWWICPLTLTKSLAAILNLLTNSFFLLDSVLALTSDNFPPSIPLATPWWHHS